LKLLNSWEAKKKKFLLLKEF